MLKDGVLPKYPKMIVNIKTIPGLDWIREIRGGLEIGALAKLADIAAHATVKQEYPLLAQAARAVASPQIRNAATLGGNLCQESRCWYFRYPNHLGGAIACSRKGGGRCFAVQGDNRYHAIMGARGCFAACPSDTAVALAALDASLAVVGPEAKRTIPVRDFYTSNGNTLKRGELVVGVRIPKAPGGARQTFLKFTLRKPIDFAIVSVATVVCIENGLFREARIALGAVAPGPIRAAAAEKALLGKPQNEATVAKAAEAAFAKARPLRENGYKVEIAKTLLKQALLS
jgi:xanthine dehydrogenase YagS FAD-binding subunit